MSDNNLIVCLLFLITVPFISVFGQNTKSKEIMSQRDMKNMETAVHLLGYISRDYPNGVKNGEIVDKQEFDEMVEFSDLILKFISESDYIQNNHQQLKNNTSDLIQLIHQKSSESDVAELSNNIKDEIIQIAGLKTTPEKWANLSEGEKLFAKNCSSCHGMKGDGTGPAGVGLEPEPTNFLDNELMQEVSAYQMFNTIKLGVPGTAMVAFQDFDEDQLWNLAFYIKSLRFKILVTDQSELQKYYDEVSADFSLAQLATLNDNEIAELMKSGDDSDKFLAALRLLKPEDTNLNSLSIAKNKLNQALVHYRNGEYSLSKDNALSAYLEGVEPVEARLKSINPGFVGSLENQMMKIRQLVSKKGNENAVEAEITKAIRMLNDAEQMMSSQQLNYWLTFLISLSIMLREGMEAFLILFVLFIITKKIGAKKAMPWLHSGWILALTAGIAGWFLSDYIIRFGGKNREIMEGLISIFAVVVLLYAGFWMHTKTNARKWQEFVTKKIGSYLEKDKMYGLMAFSFMVVFREVFEVILFLKAISLEASANNQSAIGLGSLAALLILGIIAYIFVRFSKKIPIKQIFLYSSWLVVVLAVILMGKGLHSLQESGWVSVNSIPSGFHADWLGVYPTIETVTGQLVLIMIVVLVYFWQKKSGSISTEISK